MKSTCVGAESRTPASPDAMHDFGTSPSRSRSEPSSPAATTEHSALDWARETGAAARVMEDLDQLLRRRRRQRLRLATAAAVVLGFGGLWSLTWRDAAMDRMNPDSSVTRALVIRPETRALPDGSSVELNTGAEIEVDFSGGRRHVVLRQGEAHFRVAKDPQRPFVVDARGVEVRAVGTAFSVGLGTAAIEVLVTEGRVAVEKPAPAAPPPPAASVAASGETAPAPTYGAGKRIVVELPPPGAEAAVPRVSDVSLAEIGTQLAWRVPRLEFSGTPLAQALPMFNEYGRVRLTLADPALGRLQLSGVLRADNTESLLRLLEGEFGLVAEVRGDETVLRRR